MFERGRNAEEFSLQQQWQGHVPVFVYKELKRSPEAQPHHPDSPSRVAKQHRESCNELATHGPPDDWRIPLSRELKVAE